MWRCEVWPSRAGCMAKSWHSRFSPSCPRFDSWHSLSFTSMCWDLSTVLARGKWTEAQTHIVPVASLYYKKVWPSNGCYKTASCDDATPNNAKRRQTTPNDATRCRNRQFFGGTSFKMASEENSKEKRNWGFRGIVQLGRKFLIRQKPVWVLGSQSYKIFRVNVE